MDYKINTISKEIKCDRQAFNEFPEMLFGETADGTEVFDATAYCDSLDINRVDHHLFNNVCKPFIKSIIDKNNEDPTKLFYQNKNGHYLINSYLCFLYVSLVNPDMFVYYYGLALSTISNGFAFSDNYIAALATTRIPDSVLQAIIESRKSK